MSHASAPDDRLAARASKGDQRALATIFKRYHQDLYRYCAAIVGNPEDARDALQNTMVKLLSALPGERRRIQLKPWLYRVAHNEAVEILRKRKPVDPLEAEDLAGAPDPERTVEARERLRQLISDLGELPQRQRGALLMRELGGLTFAEVGSALDTSAAAARQAVYEARLGLQEVEKGREMECELIRRTLSDSDRRVLRRRDVRTHLRHCAECREFDAAIARRRRDLTAIAPLPALAAAGILKAVLGGATGAAAGASGAAGVGAAGAGIGSIAGSTAVKSVAVVAVAGAIGISAADRADLVHVFPRADRGRAPAAIEVKSQRESTRSAERPAAAQESPEPRTGLKSKVSASGTAIDLEGQSLEGGGGESPAGSPPAAPEHSSQRGDPARAAHGPPVNTGPPPHSNAGGQGAGKANAHGGNPHSNEKASAPDPSDAEAKGGKGAGQGNAKSKAPETPSAMRQPKPPPAQENPVPEALPQESPDVPPTPPFHGKQGKPKEEP